MDEIEARIRIRGFASGDSNFVLATWKQNFWKESLWGLRVRWENFEPGHSKVIHRILARATVLVACEPQYPDDIIGYFVFEDGVAHWAYVKTAFRRMGIFRAMLNASGLPKDLGGVLITHGTNSWFGKPAVIDKSTGRELKPRKPGMDSKFPGAIHDPYFWVNP